jgi:hypothetical protein
MRCIICIYPWKAGREGGTVGRQAEGSGFDEWDGARQWFWASGNWERGGEAALVRGFRCDGARDYRMVLPWGRGRWRKRWGVFV